MIMNVSWSKQAANSLQQATAYVREEFGVLAKQKLMNEVRDFVKILSTNPKIGKIEPLLYNAPQEYRSFVINHINKAVYYINTEKDTIEIVALWDTRREPQKQAKNTK